MYGRHSQSYLERARARLDEWTLHGLFYAALELRLGVEARLKEYLEAQRHISKAKKEGWRIAKLGRNLESAFQHGDQIIQIKVLDQETKETLAVLYYTPVSKKLQNLAQRLGTYLHAPAPTEDWSQEWWSAFRTILETTWLELEKATTGTLLGAPLLHTKTRQLHMTVEFQSEEEKRQYLARVGGVGAKAVLSVSYHDELPSEKALH